MNLNSFNVSNLCIISHNLLLRSIQAWLVFFFPLHRTALIRTECFSWPLPLDYELPRAQIFLLYFWTASAGSESCHNEIAMLGACYCSPRSLSKGLILHDLYRRMELGLQSGIKCMPVFKVVLDLYVAEVVLCRVISGGSSLSWESKRGCRLL